MVNTNDFPIMGWRRVDDFLVKYTPCYLSSNWKKIYILDNSFSIIWFSKYLRSFERYKKADQHFINVRTRGIKCILYIVWRVYLVTRLRTECWKLFLRVWCVFPPTNFCHIIIFLSFSLYTLQKIFCTPQKYT